MGVNSSIFPSSLKSIKNSLKVTLLISGRPRFRPYSRPEARARRLHKSAISQALSSAEVEPGDHIQAAGASRRGFLTFLPSTWDKGCRQASLCTPLLAKASSFLQGKRPEVQGGAVLLACGRPGDRISGSCFSHYE